MFFDDDELGSVRSKKQKLAQSDFVALDRTNVKPDLFSDEELLALPVGSVFVHDVESYPNYFCAVFKHVVTGKVVYFEDSPNAKVNTDKLRFMLYHFCIVGFNSIKYDIIILALAVAGYDAYSMFRATDLLINQDYSAGDIAREFEVCLLEKVNHIDLIEVAPLQGSLKLYAGRLHCQRMQDLPYKVGTYLTEFEALNVLFYCGNDLDNTILMYLDLCPQIELREALGREYGQDLRSRSDAQIAEAVINSELEKISGHKTKRPRIQEGVLFQYNVPSFIKFNSPELNKALKDIAKASFAVDGRGAPVWPQGLGVREKSKNGKLVYVLKVKVNGKVYKLGMGGLHSTEKTVGHKADEFNLLIDRDVASYYPQIILNQKLYPKHLGPSFLVVYKTIVDKRLAAKASGNKVVADSLKITINGSFGKLGNKYSTLYAPDLLLQVTITGQLCLLMLIEMVEAAGIPVVSGNTDGIVIKCPAYRHDDLNTVINRWEQITQFVTEETRYKALYSRDVNNYIAVKEEGKPEGKYLSDRLGCKTKGIYSEVGSALNSPLSKNPETNILSDAVQNFIVRGVPIEQTIYDCRDFRRFVAVKKVKGGGHKNGVYLGKVVRWYYANGVHGQIHYIESGNAVGKSEGAKPVMDLPPSFPDDVNYDWYINEANEMLYDIGYYLKKQASLF